MFLLLITHHYTSPHDKRDGLHNAMIISILWVPLMHAPVFLITSFHCDKWDLDYIYFNTTNINQPQNLTEIFALKSKTVLATLTFMWPEGTRPIHIKQSLQEQKPIGGKVLNVKTMPKQHTPMDVLWDATGQTYKLIC